MGDGSKLARELLESSGVRFHALLTRITLRPDVADDLLQELFLKLSRSRGFVVARQPEAYAHRAAVRMAFDWRRAHRRRATVALTEHDAADGSPAPLVGLIAREEFDEVLAAMGQLSVQAQQVLTMRFLETRSYEVIAAELDHTIHQARSICHKAVVRLRWLVVTGRASLADRKSRDA